jgi:predicted alpha/beta hydrolase family esterase
MTNYLIVPGLGNSDLEHWQTYFQNSALNFSRIEQSDWDIPNCEDCIQNIDATVTSYELSSVVLIGHSLDVQPLRIGQLGLKEI